MVVPSNHGRENMPGSIVQQGEIVFVFAGNKHPNHDLWYERAIAHPKQLVGDTGLEPVTSAV